MNRTQPDDPMIPETEAAPLLGVSVGTLQVWRATKRYDLPYAKIGRAVRYRRSDIQAFIERRTVRA